MMFLAISIRNCLCGECDPLGAILLTTLFNVKINDIVKQVDQGVERSLYWDDFVIMYKSSIIDAIQRKLQHTIKRLQKRTQIHSEEIAITSIPDATIWDSKLITFEFIPPEFDKSSNSSTVFKSWFNWLKHELSDFGHM